MKTASFFIIFCLLSAILCFPYLEKEFNGDNINISVSESEDEFKFSAKFNESKTRDVRNYMDNHLKPRGDFSFKNAEIDATVTLDSKLNFYIQSSPGRLKIKLDKNKNSFENYMMLKKTCEGIKNILAGK